MSVRPNVNLHIEELVLEGFAPADRHLIGAAVESELARLFAEQGVPPNLNQSASVATLDGGSFNVASGAKPQAVGENVARSVFGGLNRGGQSR